MEEKLPVDLVVARIISIIIVIFVFIPTYAHCQSYMDEKSNMNSEEKAKNKVNVKQNTQAQEQIKAESICIGEDCRSKWPDFKCVTYDNRPVGETGDDFCAKMNKACMGVSIGSGQSFFSECSVSVNSVHKCRCCGVE
ncbi:MAG: hypothetical protein V1699_00535 [Candidatus Omnitrophota bacterium]